MIASLERWGGRSKIASVSTSKVTSHQNESGVGTGTFGHRFPAQQDHYQQRLASRSESVKTLRIALHILS